MDGIIVPDNLQVILLLYVPILTHAYEKCSQGISHDECYVGKCCKINGVWECRVDGLQECESLAEPDTSVTQKPPSSDDNTDTVSIAIPVGVAAGCLVIIILVAIFAVYMRRLYREKRRGSTQTYQNRAYSAPNSTRNRLVDNAYYLEQPPEELDPKEAYINSHKHSKSKHKFKDKSKHKSKDKSKSSKETNQNTPERFGKYDSSTDNIKSKASYGKQSQTLNDLFKESDGSTDNKSKTSYGKGQTLNELFQEYDHSVRKTDTKPSYETNENGKDRYNKGPDSSARKSRPQRYETGNETNKRYEESDSSSQNTRAKKVYGTGQTASEQNQDSDSSSEYTNQKNRNYHRKRRKSRRKTSYDNDNFQGDGSQKPTPPVWSTHQERLNGIERRNRPLRDYEETKTCPLQNNREDRYNTQNNREDRYNTENNRENRYNTQRNREDRYTTQNNREDHYNDVGQHDELEFVEPYHTKPGRSRPREDHLPNNAPHSYSESMKQTEV